MAPTAPMNLQTSPLFNYPLLISDPESSATGKMQIAECRKLPMGKMQNIDAVHIKHMMADNGTRGRVKCELRNCEWVFCALKCELTHDWSAIFRTTRNRAQQKFSYRKQQHMHTRTHNRCVCLATYCMTNYAAITVVINVKKELVHHILLLTKTETG